MAGSNRGGGGIPCPKRTIIIPQGTIDPEQNNVIHVPRNLDTSAPLLVTPPRREGGPLNVQLLPNFQDRLSQPREQSGERVGRLETEPQQCTSDYAKRRKNQKREEHLRAVAVTWPPEKPAKPQPELQNIDPEEAKRICSGVEEQNIKSFRSLSRSQTRGGPVRTQAFSMEAPGGINQQAMDRIFWESNASGYDYPTVQDTQRGKKY
nr:unnamed protein product [Callosobruchus chinensis]